MLKVLRWIRKKVAVLKFLEIEISHVQLLYLFTYLLTPWSTVLPEKLTAFQLVKKFLAFYGTRKFITALTSARHLSLSWANLIQSMPPHPKIHLNICAWIFQVGSFPQVSPPKPCIHLFSPPTCDMPRPFHFSQFCNQNLIGEYRSSSLSLCSFLHSLVTSSLLGPNILFNTLFSNSLSLCFSHNVSDQGLHPYKTAVKIIVLCILIFKFLDSRLEDKRFCTEW
jgi:hypothetical protein